MEILWSNKSCSACECVRILYCCVSVCVWVFVVVIRNRNCCLLLSLSEPNHEWYEFAACANYKYARSTHPLFTRARTQTRTHTRTGYALNRSLALSHTHERKQREEARRDDEAKPDEGDEAIPFGDLKQVPCDAQMRLCECVRLCVLVCVCEVVKKLSSLVWAQKCLSSFHFLQLVFDAAYANQAREREGERDSNRRTVLGN